MYGSVRCLAQASQMLGFMHRLQTEWRILVFGFTTDCHALQAIVASQQQGMSSGEVPLQKSFVQTQLLPRKLTAAGMLGVRKGLKGLAAIGVYLALSCPKSSHFSAPKGFVCAWYLGTRRPGQSNPALCSPPELSLKLLCLGCDPFFI